MITLGRFLKGDGEGNDQEYLRALSLLLQGIKLHTHEYNKEDYARFRARLDAIQEKLSPEAPAADTLDLVGGAIQILGDYNQQTVKRLRSQFDEMRSIIATFSRAVTTMVSASVASLVRLREIESQLSAAESVSDLRVLKIHLCDCLSGIAAEVEEHKKKSTSGMTRLSEGARNFEASAGQTLGHGVTDPVTGLPARAEAEAALSRVAGSGVPAVAAAFVMKRLKQLNSRFGRQAGDDLLSWLSVYLGSAANPEEGIFRWSGPALVAVIARDAPLVRIRQDLARLIADMPAPEVAVGARKVTAPISVGWMVFPLTAQASRLVSQVDTFVESQSAGDD